VLNSHRKSSLLVVTVSCFVVVASTAVAQQPGLSDDEFPGNRFVKIRLIADTEALVPGKTSHLAVLFDITKGWHLYWRNPGDSGLPPTVKFKPVSGLEIGQVRWPAPVKRIEGDMLVNYIHEDRLMLIYPITVGKGFVGKDIQLKADVDWLVCKEKCVSGKGAVDLRLPIGTSTTPSKEDGLFQKLEQYLTSPVSQSAPPGKAVWEGQNLVIRAPGAARMTFFPYTNEEDVYPEDMIHGGSTEGNILRLPYGPQVTKIQTVSGVLAIVRNGRESFHELTVPTTQQSPSNRSTDKP
jgi:DsbC/DsbD-like thiol-disulfide interchange protein